MAYKNIYYIINKTRGIMKMYNKDRIQFTISNIFFLFTLSSLISLSVLADDSPFVRYPALNSNGSKIAFSFQGDIWTAPTTGGKATRITVHNAYDGYPYWNNDDSQIAFSSNRFGNYDLFLIQAEGGIPKRLTFHSADDILTDFTNDNELLFTTDRLFLPFDWDYELASVSVKGGTPQRLLDTEGEMPVKSPNGKLIAFVKGWGRIQREEYKGSADFEIWIYNTETKTYNQITNNKTHDIYPRWANDNTLYFISSRTGKYNIHKVKISPEGNPEGSVEQITNFKHFGPRYFNISNDASKIVMTRGTDIYLLNLSTNNINKIDIIISSDYKLDPTVQKIFDGNISRYKISPNGKYSALVIRGDIFITPNNIKNNFTINLTKHPYRDESVAWVNDTTLIFSSDRDGQYDFFSIISSNKNERNLFKSLKHKTIQRTNSAEDESSPTVSLDGRKSVTPIISPDGKKIIYHLGAGKLIVADISSNGKISNKKTLLDGWAVPEGVTWSPNSRWIAYSINNLYFNEEVFILPIDKNHEPINISMHPRGDYSPIWSPDGSKLAFISQRSNTDNDIWIAWLNKADWEKRDEDFGEKQKGSPIQIDIENIHERLVRVTSMQGDEKNILFAKDGKTIFFTAQKLTEKKDDIFSVKYNGTEVKALTSGGINPNSLSMDKDGEFIYFLKNGKLARFNLKNGKEEEIPIKAKMKINFAQEREQIFEESWRAMLNCFYDPNFHNHDWNAIKEIYKPLCMKASTQKDFQDIYNMMLGEINASHLGIKYVGNTFKPQKEKTGFLGTEFVNTDKGLKIIHIVPDSPANKKQSMLKVGDIITKVNETKLTDKTNIYSLLTNTINEKILLTTIRNGNKKEIIIEATDNLKKQLYNEWVNQKRKLVDKWSNGKLGYLHIQEMGWESFERFEREFTAVASGKKAIIIDVRFNGGGWTTDYLLTVLTYKQHAYTIPRGAAHNLEKEKTKFRDYYPIGQRLPYAAWTKPSIALCNQNSYSNAEIFSHAYKNLEIGKLVGVPTFGAVISTGPKYLLDGSLIKVPTRGWYAKIDDEDMDFLPAIPDIIVENPPNEKIEENDIQLKRAVDELLNEIQ